MKGTRDISIDEALKMQADFHHDCFVAPFEDAQNNNAMKQYFDNYTELEKAIGECIESEYVPMFLHEFSKEKREEIAQKTERFGLYKALLVDRWFRMNIHTTLKQDLKPSEIEKQNFDAFKVELGKLFNMVVFGLSTSDAKAGTATATLPCGKNVDIYIPQMLIDEYK